MHGDTGHSRMVVLSTKSGRVVHKPPIADGRLHTTCSAFSEDGSQLACGVGAIPWERGNNGWIPQNSIVVLSVESGQMAAGTMRGHHDSILSLAFSADGWTLASASEDRDVRVWDLPAGALRYALLPLAGWAGGGRLGGGDGS